MSMSNSYVYNTQRGPNTMDILQQQQPSQQGDGRLQLDLSPHLQSGNGDGRGMNSGMSMMQSSNRMNQQPTQILSRSQQGIPVGQQQQQMVKQNKELVLKTPLSLLNEICTKAKAAPMFTVEESGPVHSRVYSCNVKVEKQGFLCEATGTGKTKKDAKQEAAKALLLQMDTQVEKLLVPKVGKDEPDATVIEVDPEVSGNPVGDLNDLCAKLKRLPPEYEDVAELGKPHERVYTVSCKLGSHIVETGRGRSKKHAKKVAAHRAHQRVLEILAKEADGVAVLKEEDNLIEKLSTLTLVSKQEAKKINEGWKLTDWVANLRHRSGPKLDQLKMPPAATLITGDPMKLLKEVAEEQKFKLDFTELDQGNNDVKTCLIAVSAGSQPLTVLLGSAVTKTQAKKVAAENFIEMLRVVLNSK